jgi:hypothetical protein
MPVDAASEVPPSGTLRIVYAVVQGISLGVLMGLCWIGRDFEAVYAQLGMNDLPLPTELAVVVGRMLRTPVGALATVGLGALLIVLGLRGTFDRFLRRLIAGNVLGTAFVTLFYLFAVYAPIVRIREQLKDR